LNRRDLLRLGIRLAGGRSAAARLRWVTSLLAVAVVAVVVLALASVPGVVSSRTDRAEARAPQVALDGAGPEATPTAVALRRTAIDGRSVTARLVGRVPGVVPAPPVGVAALPDAGESVVSPALARLLRSDDGRDGAGQFGRVVGTIAPEGLVDREELFAYVGTDADGLAAYALVHDGAVGNRVFRPHAAAGGARVWSWLVGAVVLLAGPLVALLVAAARLSEASDRRQLAALRLLGCSDRQLHLVRGGALLPAMVAGGLLGAGAFLGGLWLLDGKVIAGRAVERSDVHPGTTVLVGAALVALVVWLAGRRLVRQAVADPWTARRGSEPRPPARWGLVLLGAGAAVLAGVVVFGDRGVVDDVVVESGLAPIHVLGLALVVAGLLVSAPFIVGRIGRAVGDRARAPWLHLGGRTAGSGSGSAARWGAMVCVAVLLGSLGIQYAAVVAEGYRLNDAAPPGGLVITGASTAELPEAVEQAASGRVATIWEVTDPTGESVLVSSCRDLQRVDPRITGCRAGARAYDLDFFELGVRSFEVDGQELAVPATGGTLRSTGGFHQALGGFYAPVLVDDPVWLQAMGSAVPAAILVLPRDATQRAAVDRAVAETDVAASTDDTSSTRDRLRRTEAIDDRLARVFVGVVAGLMGVGLIVAMVDRALAGADGQRPLVAVGAGRTVRALAQATTPLLALLAAGACCIVFGALGDLSWKRVIHRPLSVSGLGPALALAAGAVSTAAVALVSWVAARGAEQGDWQRE